MAVVLSKKEALAERVGGLAQAAARDALSLFLDV